MKKTIACVIFLLLSINSFCHNTSGTCLDSIHLTNESNNDSIQEGQLITEISISENGDTIFSYRYNKFDYGDLTNDSFRAQNAPMNSEVPVIMSISSEPIDPSKYVGNISFTESVTPSGAKTYSVPITTHVNSFAPELSLSYSSQAGNGVAGYAWSIAGLSAIYAENKNIYYDGNTSALDLANPLNCAFSLDGARLITNTGGLAGNYQYETAQGFVLVKRYVSGNAISYYNAKFPNGSTARYGFTDNVSTKHIYPITEIEDMKGYIIKFEYIASGNNYYISKIKYGGKKGAEHLAELNFTYVDRTDCAPTYIDGLEVSYNKLLKSIVSYNTHNGVLQEIGTYSLTHQLVNDINQLAQLDYSIGSTYMNPIKMKYEYYDSNTPQLSKHTGLGLSQYFTNQPVFIRGKFVKNEFNDGIITFPGHFSIYGLLDEYSHPFGPNSYEFGSLFPADQQILIAPELNSYAQTKSILAEKGFQNIVAIDYNGDGTDEIVKINFNGVTPDKSRSILKITKYSYVNGSFSPTSFNAQFDDVVNSENHLYSPISRSYYYGDFLGNGKPQLLTISHCKDFYGKSRISKYTLIDLNNGSILKNGDFFDFSFDVEKHIRTIDINGDGKTELCYMLESKTEVYSFSSSGYSKLFESSVLARNSLKNVDLYGDLNGDGKMDILRAPQESYLDYKSMEVPVWGPKRCFICNGYDPIISLTSSNCRYCSVGLRFKQPLKCRVCDHPLDDIANRTPQCPNHGVTNIIDIIFGNYDYGNEWTSYISTGKGFIRKVYYIVKNDRDSEYILMDMNNDGMADLVKTFKGTATVFINKNGQILGNNLLSVTVPLRLNAVPVNLSSAGAANKFIYFDGAMSNTFTYSHDQSKANLLTKLTDSFGATYRVVYSDMATGSTYLPSSTARTFPYYSIIAPINLVKNTFTSHNDIIYQYTYHGAVMHRHGLGFCGFEKIETFNNIQQSTVTDEYDPLTFGVKIKSDSPDKRVQYSIYRNDVGNKKCNPRINAITEYDKLTKQESMVTYDYDAYNNPTYIRTYYVNGQSLPSKIINQTYLNTVSSLCYLVGLPLIKTTTNNYNGSSWADRELITYNANKLPISKAEYTGATGYTKKGEVKLEYDNFGNVISETSAPHNLTSFLGDTYTYDATGRYKITKTDVLGRQITYSDYDKFGNCTKETNHKNQSVIRTFDDFGAELTTTNIEGILLTKTKAWGGEGVYTVAEEFRYNAKPAKIIHYNAHGDEVRTGVKQFDGKWKFIDKQYDSRGRLHKISLQFSVAPASFWNEYVYDNYDRVISIIEASGKTSSWSYNGLSTTETKDGIVSTKTKDATGKVIKVTDAGGEIIYNYRPDGQPATVTVNNAIATQFKYDDNGRRTSIIDPSAGEVTYSYGYEGDISVKTITDARGKIITERTDRFDRIVSMNRPEFNTTYTYNSDGLLTNETSTNQTSKIITYDELSRIASITDNLSAGKYLLKEYAYQYYNGSIVSIKYTSQKGQLGTEGHGYNYGHKTSITWARASIWSLKEVNDLGQPTRIYSSGTTHYYTYSQYGKPTGIMAKKGDVVLQNFAYNFDEVTSNLLSRTDVSRNITEYFSYDNLNRLIGVGENTISYASNGNILQKPDVGILNYGKASKPYQVTGLTPNGGYIPHRTPQGIRYTSFQRPLWVDEDPNVVMFDYNASHNRVKMSINEQAIEVAVKYYSDNKYELITSYGKPDKEILYFGDDVYSAPAVYVKENNVGKVYYLCRDYLGSITHIINSDGTLKQELSYDAWGQLRNPVTQEVYTSANLPALFIDRGYTGHEYLRWFNIVNMNARLYDPLLGRFLSPDPYVQIPEFTQNFNRYSYCLNNPLKYTDPNGEFIFAAIFGFWKGVFTGQNPFKTAWNAIKNEALIYAGLFTSDKSKGFFGQVWEVISRFTWQAPQTWLGVTYSYFRNALGFVDEVHLYRGATYVVDGGSVHENGLTLGGFININSAIIPVDGNGNFDPTKSQLYMHEYGHYLQSQDYGLGYIRIIAIPSLISAMTSKEIPNDELHRSSHKFSWFEIGANRLAKDYFNVDWWDYKKYPIEKL